MCVAKNFWEKTNRCEKEYSARVRADFTLTWNWAKPTLSLSARVESVRFWADLTLTRERAMPTPSYSCGNQKCCMLHFFYSRESSPSNSRESHSMLEFEIQRYSYIHVLSDPNISRGYNRMMKLLWGAKNSLSGSGVVGFGIRPRLKYLYSYPTQVIKFGFNKRQ